MTTMKHCYDCSTEEWAAFIAAMQSGGTIEIDEEMFGYWLEVLPPQFMGRKVNGRRYAFGFAEGAEEIIGFYREGGKFFCEALEIFAECN